jgi:hypothetical protein
MNRHQRRHRAALQRGVRALCRDAGAEHTGSGVYSLVLIDRDEMLHVARAADRGDDYARRLADLVAQMLIRIHDAPPEHRPLCLLCDTEFTATAMPAALTIMHAWRDDPQLAMCNGLCRSCRERYPTWAELQTPVLDACRRVFPDLRAVDAANIH